jgi:hypothetical protein
MLFLHLGDVKGFDVDVLKCTRRLIGFGRYTERPQAPL